MQDLQVKLRIDGETGQVRLEVKNLDKDLKDLGDTGYNAGENISKGMEKAGDSISSVEKLTDLAIGKLKQIVTVGAGAKLAKEFVAAADQAKLLDARISLVTDTQSQFNIAQSETVRIALDTHTALGTTVELYTRLERSLKGQSVAQTDVLRITETVNKALAVSGATVQETSSVITQLSQGLAAGVLRGEEFNAVNESGSRIMQVLKDDLNKTSGELREMAFAGELTTEIITGALLRQSEAIGQEFSQLPVTVAQAFTDLRTNFTLYAKDINDSVDVTGALAKGIQFVGENISTLINIIGAGVVFRFLGPTLSNIGKSAILASGGLSKLSVSMVATRTQATLMTGALSLANKSIALLGGPAGAALFAAFGIYELISSMSEGESQANQFATTIQNVSDAISTPIDSTSIEDITEKYAGLRLEVTQLTGEIEKQKSLDDVINAQAYIDGVSSVSSALQRQQQATLGLLTVSEKLDQFMLKIKESTDAYKESLKSASDQTQQNVASINEWLESSEKQQQKLARQNEIHGLTEVQVIELDAARIKALATDDKTIKKIDAITKSLLEEAKERENLLKLDKEKKEREKANAKLLEEAQGVLEQYGTKAQQVAIAERLRTEELQKYAIQAEKMPGIIDAVNRKYDAQIDQILGIDKAKEELAKREERENELLQEQYQAQLDLIANLEFEESLLELTTFEREKAILSRELEAKNIRLTTEELERLLKVRGIEKGFGANDTFESLISQGKTLGDILKQAAEGFKSGLEGGAQSLNVLLQGGQFVFDTFRSHSGKDGTGQILSTINDLAPLFGPVGAAISGIANTINSIFGGGLFGTSFETTGSTANLAIGENGVGGQLAIRRKRKKSLFRGNEYQTLFEDLDAQVINGLETLRESALQSVAKIASQLGIEVPELISAGFFKEFDKDGNLIREYSEIAGREFNESFKEFSSRFLAENLIAALNGVLPQVQRTVTNYVPDYDSLEFGSPDYIPVQSTEEVGEAEFLAGRFRDQGAQALLDFAQFATIAVTQMQDNAALLGTLTENLDITQELQGPGESLVETYNRISTATSIYKEALGVMGISLDVTRQEFIRLSASMAEAAGGTQQLASLWQNYFDNFFTPEELRAQSLQSSSELLGQQAANLGIDPTITQEQFRELFQAQIAAGNLTEEQQVLWLQFATTLSNVNDLIEQNTAAEQERLEALQQAQQNYTNFNESIADQLAAIGNSETINSIAEIRAQHEQNIATLNDLAIAAGEAGASELELMRVHQLAQAQIDQTVGRLRQAIATLQNQLYSDDLERRIAELEEIEGVNRRGFASVQSSSNSLFDNWRRAIDNLRDYSQSLIFSQHSPIEAGDQLDQALADFYAAVAAAQGGNLEAAQSLPGLADLVLGLNDQVNASGSDFNVIFDGVQDALNSIDIPNGISNNIIQGNFSVTPSAELQGLYDQLEARNAAASADNRLQLATQLAQHLRELALAVNQPLFNIAGEIGLNMTNLVTDLGVNLDNLTAESVQNLANISNLLGVELSDLATNLGDGVSEALGELADAQSLLNDALEGSIEGLPTEYRDLLAPLLRNVENAADGTAQEVALQALEDATNGLPIEYRNLLAPYFDNIDQTTEMSLQSGYMQEQIDWMHRIHDLVAEGIQTPPQEPSPPPNPASAGITSLDNIVYPDFNQNINTVSNQQNQNTETAELKKLVKKQTEVIEELKTIIKFQHIDKMNANNKIIANTEDTAQNTKQSSFPHTNRKIGK